MICYKVITLTCKVEDDLFKIQYLHFAIFTFVSKVKKDWIDIFFFVFKGKLFHCNTMQLCSLIRCIRTMLTLSWQAQYDYPGSEFYDPTGDLFEQQQNNKNPSNGHYVFCLFGIDGWREQVFPCKAPPTKSMIVLLSCRGQILPIQNTKPMHLSVRIVCALFGNSISGMARRLRQICFNCNFTLKFICKTLLVSQWLPLLKSKQYQLKFLIT